LQPASSSYVDHHPNDPIHHFLSTAMESSQESEFSLSPVHISEKSTLNRRSRRSQRQPTQKENQKPTRAPEPMNINPMQLNALDIGTASLSTSSVSSHGSSPGSHDYRMERDLCFTVARQNIGLLIALGKLFLLDLLVRSLLQRDQSH
jgi:hypothetical protein